MRDLTVRRLSGDAREGLRPLAGFKELRRLLFEQISNVDLVPLAELELDLLDFSYIQDVDLSPLATVGGLRSLGGSSMRDCHVPSSLALPDTLQGAAFSALGPGYTGAPVKALIDAIEWPRLGDLRYLDLGVEPTRPITVDLGFLRELPRLERLRIDLGIWHEGERPSPLEPPFEGLPRTLKWVRIDAWDPTAVKAALAEYLPRAEISVRQREQGHPGGEEWAIDPADDEGSEWGTYGSFWQAAYDRDSTTEYDTESEALEAVKRTLRHADRALLERLDFDPESDGTGITAPTREDLENALRILGIR